MEWEVWEVAVRPLADAPPTPLAYGPGGESGWLCFESPTQRRRLARYPARWAAMLPRELEALCQTARPVRAVPASPPRVRAADGW